MRCLYVRSNPLSAILNTAKGASILAREDCRKCRNDGIAKAITTNRKAKNTPAIKNPSPSDFASRFLPPISAVGTLLIMR